LIRATTSNTSESGSISRAAADACLALLGQLLLAERQDRVGIETVEGAQLDHPVMELAPHA
jgi:hypothetical protein